MELSEILPAGIAAAACGTGIVMCIVGAARRGWVRISNTPTIAETDAVRDDLRAWQADYIELANLQITAQDTIRDLMKRAA